MFWGTKPDPGLLTEVHARSFFFTIKDTSRHHVGMNNIATKEVSDILFYFFFLEFNVLLKGMLQICKFYIVTSF